jgi:hypothetical protein
MPYIMAEMESSRGGSDIAPVPTRIPPPVPHQSHGAAGRITETVDRQFKMIQRLLLRGGYLLYLGRREVLFWIFYYRCTCYRSYERFNHERSGKANARENETHKQTQQREPTKQQTQPTKTNAKLQARPQGTRGKDARGRAFK